MLNWGPMFDASALRREKEQKSRSLRSKQTDSIKSPEEESLVTVTGRFEEKKFVSKWIQFVSFITLHLHFKFIILNICNMQRPLMEYLLLIIIVIINYYLLRKRWIWSRKLWILIHWNINRLWCWHTGTPLAYCFWQLKKNINFLRVFMLA